MLNVSSSEDEQKQRDEYLKELELINDLPELLLGQDGRNATISQFDKKIICDYDDFDVAAEPK